MDVCESSQQESAAFPEMENQGVWGPMPKLDPEELASQGDKDSSSASIDALPRSTAEVYRTMPELATRSNDYPAEQNSVGRRVIIIGIAGPSGVGKSALGRMLAKQLQPHAQIMYADSCFCHAHQRNAPTEGRDLTWETPDAMDFKKLEQQISSECKTMSKRKICAAVSV